MSHDRIRRKNYLIYLVVIILGLCGGMAFSYVQKALPIMRMRYAATHGARNSGQDLDDDTVSAVGQGRRTSRANAGFIDKAIYEIYEDIKDIKDSWGKYTKNSLDLERDRMTREKLK